MNVEFAINTEKKSQPAIRQSVAKEYKIVGQNKNRKTLKRAIDLNLPVLIIGETGTGKTSIVRELSKEKGATLTRVNLNGQTSTDEILGKWLVKDSETYWQDGVLIRAMKEGHWILVDEINAALPEILFALHSLLDDDRRVLLAEKDGETIEPEKEFRFFATMNPSDEYAGTKELNKAFLSRFPVILNFGFVSQKIETKLVKDRCGLGESDSALLVDYARKIRQLKDKEEVFYTMSTRDLLFWGNFVKEMGMFDAFEIAVLNRASKEDKETLKREYTEIIGEIDKIKEEYEEETVEGVLNKLNAKIQEFRNKKEELEDAKDRVIKETAEAISKSALKKKLKLSD